MEADRRKFYRVRIPIELFLDGRGYRVLDWSLGGLSVAASGQPSPAVRTLIDGILRVTQKGVDVLVNVKLRVIYREHRRSGMAFENILPEQLSVLRTLILGHGLPQLARLSPAGADSDAGAEHDVAVAAGRGSLRHHPLNLRSPQLWSLAGATVIAFLLAFGRSPCLSDRSVAAAVAAPAVPIVAAESGYVAEVLVAPGALVAAAQPILSIRSRTDPAETFFIGSPRDCVVLSLAVKVGMELRPGQVIAAASASDANADLVEALFNRDSEPQVGEDVSVTVPDLNRAAAGRITSLGGDGAHVSGLPPAVRDDPRHALAIITLEESLELGDVGLPVRVDLTDKRRFSGMCAVWQRLFGAGGAWTGRAQ